MYQHIMVPVDGSEYSEQVIPAARVIAASIGAEITLLHVSKDDTKRSQDVVKAIQRRALALDLECRIVVAPGEVSAEILREASLQPDTLIAITSHGRSGLINMLLGSVAREVIRAASVPVLLYRPRDLRDRDVPERITEVILPLDGHPLAETMTAEAAAWSRALNAQLTLLQVIPPSRDDESAHLPAGSSDLLETSYLARQARSIRKEFDIESEYDVLHGDPVTAIAAYVKDRADVMAVMATRGRSPLREAVLGSVTSGLLHRAGIPLIVQAPDRIPEHE